MPNELILIVEDDDNSRKLLRDTLQVMGYATLEAVTGEAGVELATQKGPRLVLMDIQLPGINGVEALARLRADPRTQTIPVIAVTASVMSTQQNDLLRAGFDGLEPKPISIVGLVRKMRALLDRSPPQPA